DSGGRDQHLRRRNHARSRRAYVLLSLQVGFGQVEGEGTSLPRHALQPDFAAQQMCDLAADGKAQPRAAVLAAGSSIRLLEGFEDDALLLCRNTDAGVFDRERDDAARGRKRWVVRLPAGGNRFDAKRDSAALGELECVGKQVLQHLLETL